MSTNRVPINGGFMLGWGFMTLIGVVVGFLVFFVAMSILGEALDAIPVWAASLILAFSLGTVIGLAQWAVLRRRVQQTAAWIWATLLGFLVSGPAMVYLSGGFGPYIRPLYSLGMTAVMGVVLGMVQWFTIRKKVRQAALWIGISLVSWVLAGVVGVALSRLSYSSGPIYFWLGLIFFGTAFSAAGMAWWLNRPEE